MKAIVTVEVEPKYARRALIIAGFDVDNKSDKEICEMAIKMNDCYAVETKNINLEKEIKNKTLDEEAQAEEFFSEARKCGESEE